MSDQDLLRRQVRAAAVVNHQLHAQLESMGQARPRGGGDAPAGTSRTRRGGTAPSWLRRLSETGGSEQPFVGELSDGRTYLIERPYRRRLKVGVLLLALEQTLGARREITTSEFDSLRDGPPVEVLEAESGPPFIVVGGTRRPLRGLPVPYPASDEDAALFPMGEELDVSPGALARARLRAMLAPRSLGARVRRASARRGGLFPAARAFVQRRLRRLRR